MRFVTQLILASFLLNIFLTIPALATSHTAEEFTAEEVTPVNSYELFWPIVAGKVMGESLYFLKSFKEAVREFFIFSDFKKADYNITLSEKRTVEAEKLLIEKKDYENAKKSLDAAQTRREKALTLIGKAEERGQHVADLQNRFVSSLEKQRALLNYLATQLPDEPKAGVEESVSELNSLLARLE